MPKARTLDHQFWKDPEIGHKLSDTERLILVGIFTHLADDHGRLHADPRLIESSLFPYRRESKIAEICGTLRKCLEIFGSWSLYRVGGSYYIEIGNFDRWQAIRYKCASSIPPKTDEKAQVISISAFFRELSESGILILSDNVAANSGNLRKSAENFCCVGLGSVDINPPLPPLRGLEDRFQPSQEPQPAPQQPAGYGDLLTALGMEEPESVPVATSAPEPSLNHAPNEGGGVGEGDVLNKNLLDPRLGSGSFPVDELEITDPWAKRAQEFAARCPRGVSDTAILAVLRKNFPLTVDQGIKWDRNMPTFYEVWRKPAERRFVPNPLSFIKDGCWLKPHPDSEIDGENDSEDWYQPEIGGKSVSKAEMIRILQRTAERTGLVPEGAVNAKA